MTSNWARFWAVDLHVHTPGSADAKDEDFGTAHDIVKTALAAGLDAIAVTDHNTVAWCGAMADAATGTGLVVLPGFELSTPEGHLLGIWEEGTAPSILEDSLICLGIKRSHFGGLAVVASKGMAECAAEIREKGGIAIAAHIDKERGILTQPVQTHVNQLLGNPNITAFEYVLPETPAKVAAKIAAIRQPPLTQSSDAYDASLSRHARSGIGVRRTWIKAARPDLCGLRYALDDPDLRVSLTDPRKAPPHPTIDSLSITGGFLSGTSIDLSPDLNCLLGGTGAGKSLVLEALRFALDQRADGSVFAAIGEEVERRLESALGQGSDVVVAVRTSGDAYRISRTYGRGASQPLVEQDVDGEWVQVDRDPASLLPIAAFSQGEILEHARQPVGRMALVDAHLDLADVERQIADCEAKLRTNGRNLIASRTRVQNLTEKAAEASKLKERERELSALFDGDLVKAQGKWTSEQGAIKTLAEAVKDIHFSRPDEPSTATAKMGPEHDAQFERIRVAQAALKASIDAAEKQINADVAQLTKVVGEVRDELEVEFKVFKTKLDETLERSGATSLTKLRRELEAVQTALGTAEAAAKELSDQAQPEYEGLGKHRETLLAELRDARKVRRVMRRDRAAELNKKMAGFVKIDVPSQGDTTDYRRALDLLKVGSRVKEPVLDLIATGIGPFNLARALWSGDLAQAGKLPSGVTAPDISRLLTNVADRDLWQDLLDVQLIDTPDVLNVKFRKPDGGGNYASIEDLSHGQKCTAILVILLADGDSPVLVDQPEDALHAPWIEEYLVDRLRKLRGTRQYIFATRSPGLVVSADSEQLITMRATAGKGEVEASGSLERYDLNQLALHHLEGGRVPFARRASKLGSSLLGG